MAVSTAGIFRRGDTVTDISAVFTFRIGAVIAAKMKSKIHCLVGADIISRIQLRRHGLDVATVDRIAGCEFEVKEVKGGDVLIWDYWETRPGGHTIGNLKQWWLPLDVVTIL